MYNCNLDIMYTIKSIVFLHSYWSTPRFSSVIFIQIASKKCFPPSWCQIFLLKHASGRSFQKPPTSILFQQSQPISVLGGHAHERDPSTISHLRPGAWWTACWGVGVSLPFSFWSFLTVSILVQPQVSGGAKTHLWSWIYKKNENL